MSHVIKHMHPIEADKATIQFRVSHSPSLEDDKHIVSNIYSALEGYTASSSICNLCSKK